MRNKNKTRRLPRTMLTLSMACAMLVTTGCPELVGQGSVGGTGSFTGQQPFVDQTGFAGQGAFQPGLTGQQVLPGNGSGLDGNTAAAFAPTTGFGGNTGNVGNTGNAGFQANNIDLRRSAPTTTFNSGNSGFGGGTGFAAGS